MSIRSWFAARFYDATMRGMERACLAGWRSELLGGLEGEVLEIGSGTGANLPHYPESVTRLVLSEPDPHMRGRLGCRAAEHSRLKPEIRAFASEQIGLPDASVDVVVSTLVLCSVDSPSRALAEVRRVLKPGGNLVFIEHVSAGDDFRLFRWQRFFQPVWVRACGNCHLTRETEQTILEGGFRFETIDRIRSSGSPAIVSPTIKGKAIGL